MLARICEEYGLRPSDAFTEWWEAPSGMIEDMLEARAYAITKAQIDAAADRKSQPTGRLADTVRAIEFGLMQSELVEKEAASGG